MRETFQISLNHRINLLINSGETRSKQFKMNWVEEMMNLQRREISRDSSLMIFTQSGTRMLDPRTSSKESLRIKLEELINRNLQRLLKEVWVQMEWKWFNNLSILLQTKELNNNSNNFDLKIKDFRKTLMPLIKSSESLMQKEHDLTRTNLMNLRVIILIVSKTQRED